MQAFLSEQFQPMPQIPFAAPARPGPRTCKRIACAALAVAAALPAAAATQPTPVLLDAMTTELHRAFTSSASRAMSDQQLPPYFLSYSVSDASMVSISAQYGALVSNSANHIRVADVQVRLGSPRLDNTHGDHRSSAVNSLQLPLGDDREALARSLWLATNTGYGNALDNYLRVKTEAEVRAKEEDSSPDFSKEAAAGIHRQACAAGGGRPRSVGTARARSSPRSSANSPMSTRTWWRSRCRTRPTTLLRLKVRRSLTPHMQARLVVVAVTRADDGMDLFATRPSKPRPSTACPPGGDGSRHARTGQES